MQKTKSGYLAKAVCLTVYVWHGDFCYLFCTPWAPLWASNLSIEESLSLRLVGAEELSRLWQGQVFCLAKHRTGPGWARHCADPDKWSRQWPQQPIRAAHQMLRTNHRPAELQLWWLARSVHRARRLDWPDQTDHAAVCRVCSPGPALQNVAQHVTPGHCPARPDILTWARGVFSANSSRSLHKIVQDMAAISQNYSLKI